MVRIGLKSALHRDLYHWFLTLPLPAVAGVCVAIYLAINLLFGLLYLIQPNSVANVGPGDLADAFFFSVQTLATIGFGNMYPQTLYANILVTIEAVTGILYFALITGLLFTRFSRPSARVRFSKVAVVSLYDGAPTLMFRLANERHNQILQAEIQVTLLRSERSPEGTMMWRQRDLTLVRGQSSFFSLSWTILHRIDEQSPFWGETAETLAASEAEIVVLMAGVDEVLSQRVYARHTYASTDVVWGFRFIDVLKSEGDEFVLLDMTRFHDVEPAPIVVGEIPAPDA